MAKGQIIEKPTDALKGHYVLEFPDLKEDKRYSKTGILQVIYRKPAG